MRLKLKVRAVTEKVLGTSTKIRSVILRKKASLEICIQTPYRLAAVLVLREILISKTI
jgi:hypothetical protein